MKSPLPYLFTLISLLTSFHVASAKDWYVDVLGDDTKDGTTSATAFRSLQKAADLTEPGDTVLIGDGIYTNEDIGKDSAVLSITKSGNEEAWITWKAAPGAHPDLRPIGWNGIFITGSYNILDGLTVTGLNDSIVFADALKDGLLKEKDGKKYAGDPKFNTNGIFFTGRNNEPNNKPHHLIVRNCTVRKCPGGGVTGIEVDYFTVEDCIIFENAWFMRYGGSGISTLDNWTHDDKPGYHNIIQRNKVWNNRTNVPWLAVERLSDGNGIILDVTDLEVNGAANPDAAPIVTPGATPTPATVVTPAATPKPERPEWKGRTLVANNLSVYNGGSGIHTFRHKHADIINNTTYSNGHNVGYPELFANRSEDINILNNIIIPRTGGKVTSANRNVNVRWDYNVYPIAQKEVVGPNDLVVDPLVIQLDNDLREGDFHLQVSSPAIDSGTDEFPQATDLAKTPRPAGKARDRGAYEQ